MGKGQSYKLDNSVTSDVSIYDAEHNNTVNTKVDFAQILMRSIDTIRYAYTTLNLTQAKVSITFLETILTPYYNEQFKDTLRKIRQFYDSEHNKLDPTRNVADSSLAETLELKESFDIFGAIMELLRDNNLIPSEAVSGYV